MGVWKVTCKEKHSLYERIIAITAVSQETGNHQRFTEDEAINRIEKETDEFYDERPAGHRVKLVVAQREGRKYLKTEADGEKPNNLLSLPDCPAKKSDSSGAVRTVVAAASHGDGVPFEKYWGA